MNQFEYSRMRLIQEDERARKTMGTEAELIHRALAARYAQMASAALSAAAANAEDVALAQSA